MGKLPWGEGGSISDPRYITEAPKKGRRRCTCGCGQWATHTGMANGVALMGGCELSVRRWVRNPSDAFARRRRVPIMNQRSWSALWLASIMIESAGRFPTFDEVRRVVGLRSKAGAVRVVNGLINMGLVSRPDDANAQPTLTDAGRAALREPS